VAAQRRALKKMKRNKGKPQSKAKPKSPAATRSASVHRISGGYPRIAAAIERTMLVETPAAADVGLSTRSAVYGCVRTLTGDANLEIKPQMTVGALGVNRIGLGTCLNKRLGLAGHDQYVGDEIGIDW
jgi:hypothetical protein